MAYSASGKRSKRSNGGGGRMEKTCLSEELATFEKNHERLLATAEGRFTLIKGRKVCGTYDSQSDAIAEGCRLFGPVPFLVKQVVKIETPLNLVSNLLAV